MENQAYISHVHLKGYKSIRDMEVDLLPGLNIIIGPNGSGKTNFLEFLDKSIHFRPVDTDSISDVKLEVEHNSIRFVRESTFFGNQTKKYTQIGILKEEIFLNNNLVHNINKKLFNFDDNAFFIGFEFDSEIMHPIHILLFANIFNFGFHQNLFLIDKPIKYVQSEKNFSREFNTPYPSINHMIGQYSSIIDIWENKLSKKHVKYAFGHIDYIAKILAKYTPIKDVKLSDSFFIDQKNRTVENIFYEYLVNGNWVRWEQLSDGTKRIFLIITEISYESTIFFLEEPELGIHPDQLHLLMDFLKEQSKVKQIIITTHSPEVLNILEKDELNRIIVTRYDSEKGTQMHKLSPHQIRKGQIYMKEVGYLSHYWVHSNLEEYEEQDTE
jgi:AAA15 family ATPase/GTPase